MTATRHANARAPLAPHIRAEDLSVQRDAREVWRTITSDPAIAGRINETPIAWKLYRLRKTEARNDPLELLAELAIGLANAGMAEAQLRRFPLFLNRIIDDCYVGSAHRELADLDRAEEQIEHQEDDFVLERHIMGNVAPEALEAEAATNEAEAAVQLERARELRRRARMARNGMAVAR